MVEKWTEDEIEILKTYYPEEGGNTYKRLDGRTEQAVRSKVFKLGIKSNKKRVRWELKEEELVADFYLKHKELSFGKVLELLDILYQNGFKEHTQNAVDKKLENYSYLETGVGLSHVANQTRTIYKKKNGIN